MNDTLFELCVIKFNTIEHHLPLTHPYLSQVLTGVRACHEVGIVHLDVKPENILLRRPARRNQPFDAILADFGCARLEVTHTNQIMSKTTNTGVSQKKRENETVAEMEMEMEMETTMEKNHQDSTNVARKHHGKKEEEKRAITNALANLSGLSSLEGVGTCGYAAPELTTTGAVGTTPSFSKKSDIWSIGITTFVVLMQEWPWATRHVSDFESEEAEELAIAASVRKGVIDVSGIETEWESLSVQARDFIDKTVRADAGERMSVEEALAHPWIAQVS